MSSPLADKIRPQTLDEVVGQRHILGSGKVLRRIAESGNVPNLIFYGPSGVGKTTVARIIAKAAGKKLFKLNGTTASTADIKAVVAECDTFGGLSGVLLYLDEIQYLNKKQQQSLLEFIENGQVTLIASTTENPYFYVYNAILSRSTVFEFKPVTADEILPAVKRAFDAMGAELGCKVAVSDEVIGYIAESCGGDVRKAVNAAELCTLAAVPEKDGVRTVTMDYALQVAQRSAMRYDKDGEAHYDIVSALQKSVRGSDENAALHYLARLLEAGDLLSACRRLTVMAAEDVGLAYPIAITIVKSCVDAALQLGLPEAQLPLAEAVILMCTAPKSNSAYLAMAAAVADVKAGKTGDIPRALQNKHCDGAEVEEKGQFYKYPHDYPNHWVRQQYLPNEIKDKVYYNFGENKTEQMAMAYREMVRQTEGKKT
ncbi:MAG: replication-associated recombination protein A [Hydrogenoanaerobacterium sp.]